MIEIQFIGIFSTITREKHDLLLSVNYDRVCHYEIMLHCAFRTKSLKF